MSAISRAKLIKDYLRKRFGEDAAEPLIQVGMDFANHTLGCDQCIGVTETHPEGRTNENAKLLCPAGQELHVKFEAMLAAVEKVN